MVEFYSNMGKDIREMIELKVATNFQESTYVERSKSFDKFCSESFPNETVITETIALSWIKEALDNHTRNVAHSRIAYLRSLAQHQRAMGKQNGESFADYCTYL